MNIHVSPDPPPSRASLIIEVVHDLVCPWCYLGVRRLARTLARRPDIAADLIWRPFLLNPDMPRSGMARDDYVLRKFGGEDRARRLYASISDIGRAEGIDFRFDRIVRTPSSVDAHRLVRWASLQQAGTAIANAVFRAHFTEGLDIGDKLTLAQIAGACGLAADAAYAWLSSETDAEIVHADNLRAHRLGINGVPCLVIDGRHAIAGAQDAEVIERLLDVALVAASEF